MRKIDRKINGNCDTEVRETRFKTMLVMIIPIFVLLFLLLFPLFIPVNNEVEIRLHIPNNLNLRYYDDDNVTSIYQSNYSVYLIMISGEESDLISTYHINHFIDQKLLAYFFDIDDGLYNLSYINNSFLFNGKIISWKFEYNSLNSYFGIGAMDFSIYNQTGSHYYYMDFGNDDFLNLSLKQNIYDIYINEISCFHEYNNVYRPFLNFTYNGVNYLEKMAWNGTILI